MFCTIVGLMDDIASYGRMVSKGKISRGFLSLIMVVVLQLIGQAHNVVSYEGGSFHLR